MTAQAVCRYGDITTGICNGPGHPPGFNFTATWATCSPDVSVDGGLGIVRVGDTGPTNCGHTIQATVGSSLGKVNGLAIQRVGDPVIVIQSGSGISQTGSPTFSCN